MASFDAETTRQDQRGDMLQGSYGNSVGREEKEFTVRYRKLLIGRPYVDREGNYSCIYGECAEAFLCPERIS
ncbi:hypothetical protein ACIRFF_23275 [Streptomyces cyaneofuscatus]